ncbi:MAG: GNAT family N-acetyltransferase [Flavobacterium sp.]|nr:GNAT family N-acetyltransferase [Flavobacterium sp.]
MQIIQATKQQLSIVQELAYKIWPDAYAEILSEVQLDYMLENFYSIAALETQLEKGHVFLLAEENNSFFGFASYEINCNETAKTKLHKIYVLPSTQGTGLGKLFLETVENYARKAQNTHLFLNVNKYNKAQNFYEKQNFKIILEEVIPIGNGFIMDDYVMEKEL